MAVALSELRRRFFDRMDEGSSQYVSATQALDCINEAYSLLWGMYARADDRFTETEALITPLVNVRDYPLPANFRRVVAVYSIPTGSGPAATSYHIPMRRFGRREYIGGSVAPYNQFFGGAVPMYELLGNNLRLNPTPVVTPNYQIGVWYVAHYTPLSVDGDTLDPVIYPGHEQWIVNQAVILLKIGKEEQPAADLQAANASIQAEIAQDLAQRDMANARPVLDCNRYDGWA